ncbi:MAG: hypothetical protein R2716_06465 [Microthrixaceae bacterium]
MADPLCGDDMPLTYSYAAAMLRTIADVMSPEGIASTPPGLPVLLVTGSRDPVSNMGEQVRLLEDRLRAAGASVTAVYYEGALTNCSTRPTATTSWPGSSSG